MTTVTQPLALPLPARRGRAAAGVELGERHALPLRLIAFAALQTPQAATDPRRVSARSRVQ